MYARHLQLCQEHFPTDFAVRCVERIHRTDRWFSFDKFHQTCRTVEKIMRDIGMQEVETLTWPADGVTDYGGWMMPLAWDAREATLEVVSPKVRNRTICRYTKVPCSLMLSSAPTPPEGVTGELRIVEGKDLEKALRTGSLAGAFVLMKGSPGMEDAIAMLKNGVLGILSESVFKKEDREELGDEACRWHNFTFPLWKGQPSGRGFSLSSRQGQRLRSMAKGRKKVVLKATVDAALHEGELPLVTGVLKGESGQELVWAGHLFEQGANDNASGPAAGLAFVKMLNDLIARSEIKRPKKSIRLFFMHEARSTMAYLNTMSTKKFVAAVNADMIATPHGPDFHVRLRDCGNVLPSYAGPLIQDLLAAVNLGPVERTPAFASVDAAFADPAVGVPSATFITWPEAPYHTSADTPEHISRDTLERSGVALSAYLWFLADAGKDEVAWIARRTAADRKQAFVAFARDLAEKLRDGRIAPSAADEQVQFQIANSRLGMKAAPKLVPAAARGFPRKSVLTKLDDFDVKTGMRDSAAVGLEVARLTDELVEFCNREWANAVAGLSEAVAVRDRVQKESDEKRLSAAVPLRTFKGLFAMEKYIGKRGVPAELKPFVSGWRAAQWITHMLVWSNGKRTLLDIQRMLAAVGEDVPAATLLAAFRFFRDDGYVKARPVVTQTTIQKALRRLGLKKGNMVFAHTSLSWCGYIAGGADTVIAAFLNVLGKEGTLALPTFTCSFVGSPPYDRETSPSGMGLISETFRKRKGVKRSEHPTHAVGAIGKRATWLVKHHPPEENPLIKEGPFGKLYRASAAIVMFCRPGPNTIMHAGELWGGAPLPQKLQAGYMKDGKRREVTLRSSPWHTTAFDSVYDLLRRRNQVREVILGENPILAMDARDVIDASLDVIRENPNATVNPDCPCNFCRSHTGR